MKYGMNLLLWTDRVTEQHFPLLRSVKRWGFDGVELPLFTTDRDTIAAIKKELDDNGLASTAVTVCTADTNPISPDPAVRQAALDYLKQRIDWCRDLGSEVLCGPFHSALGLMKGRGRFSEEWEWCVETLRHAAEHAEQAGVKLSVEPLNRFEVYFLNTASDASQLVQEVGHPSLGYLYDTFHANIEERGIYESIVANRACMNHVHISENDRGIPGMGHVDWENTFKALKVIGYDGWLTIEAFGRALPELAAATCIWRDLFDSEAEVATYGLEFLKARWES